MIRKHKRTELAKSFWTPLKFQSIPIIALKYLPEIFIYFKKGFVYLLLLRQKLFLFFFYLSSERLSQISSHLSSFFFLLHSVGECWWLALRWSHLENEHLFFMQYMAHQTFFPQKMYLALCLQRPLDRVYFSCYSGWFYFNTTSRFSR